MKYLLIMNGRNLLFRTSFFLIFFILFSSASFSKNKQEIKALYIPLADHYAAIVAYEKYRHVMKFADFKIQKMKNWDLLRAYFQSGEVDMAYVMTPLALDMFNESPHFRWIGLMHRDGNALAINDLLNKKVKLPVQRKDRKPDDKVAVALKEIYTETGKMIEIGMPHLLSTHTVVLYQYLKKNGLKLSLGAHIGAEVLAISVAPPKSPAYLRANNNRNIATGFEQSLPWADVVETGGFGKVAWYSKDVMKWNKGHVECITLATDNAIKNKTKAVAEVMFYIRKSGEDIEKARNMGGENLEEIVKMIRLHIKAHTRKAIIASLDPKLRVINYENLNIDEAGLIQIMDLAVEGNILKKPVNIKSFVDHQFDSTNYNKSISN